MYRYRYILGLIIVGLEGCAATSPPTAKIPQNCDTQSGWLDASNGCSSQAGYPDCYLVCPAAGTRVRVQKSGTASGEPRASAAPGAGGAPAANTPSAAPPAEGAGARPSN